MNMQNLKRPLYDKQGVPIPETGELRQSILAPKGYQLAVQDSGQIEARVNGWLWGQNDLMEAFVASDAGTGSDAYCNFASLVYGRPITKADKDERFLGKVCVLGLGYSMGADKFQLTLAKGALGGPPILLSDTECRRIVNLYRRANYKIVQGWDKCKEIINHMYTGKVGSYKCIAWEKEKIWLPNGMSLKYPDLKQTMDANGWDAWSYQSGDMRKKIYGGLLCLGADTQVLTDNGWKRLISVQDDDRLWDGATWVDHSGLAYQGTKETINFGGVHMTPDHEVRVGDYWIAAKETTHHEATSSFEEYHRTPPRIADGNEAHWQRRTSNLLVGAMRLWADKINGRIRFSERKHSELRMCDKEAPIRSKINSRDVKSSSVLSVEKHVGSMPTTYASVLGTLRRARNYSLRGVDQFSSLLVRYADWVRTGLGLRQMRQFSGVLQGQLQMGDPASKHSQHESPSTARYSRGTDTFMAGCRNEWNRSHDSELPARPRMACREDVRQTKFQEQKVYDILNAGPRRRFTVRGDDGKPFLVHNCENLVQALARIIVMGQMMDINKQYRVVMSTHDECVALAKSPQADKCLSYMEKCMRTPPLWCSDIPLSSEGGAAHNYSK